MNTTMGFPVGFGVDDLACDLAVGLADDLVAIGFEWFPEESRCDGLLLFEAICSLLLKYQGLGHYLQPFANVQCGRLIAFPCPWPYQSWRAVETPQNNIKTTEQWAIIDEATDVSARMLVRRLRVNGIDIPGEKGRATCKSFALIGEAIRSLLCRYYRICHPLQEIAKLLPATPPRTRNNILH